MPILTKDKSPRYKRDGITSTLLVAESTCNAHCLTTSFVEMSPDGKQHLRESLAGAGHAVEIAAPGVRYELAL